MDEVTIILLLRSVCVFCISYHRGALVPWSKLVAGVDRLARNGRLLDGTALRLELDAVIPQAPCIRRRQVYYYNKLLYYTTLYCIKRLYYCTHSCPALHCDRAQEHKG